MSISYHKKRLVSSHQSVGRWSIFCMRCSKNILMKLVGYQQPTCLCVNMEFVVRTISLSCELFSLSKAAFVHVGPAQFCTENRVSICMCRAVEVAWLAPVVCLRGGERGTCLGPPFLGTPLRCYAHKFSLILVKNLL